MMKFKFLLVVLCLSLLLLLVFKSSKIPVFESSSLNDTPVRDITRGPSVSPTPHDTFIGNITRGSSISISFNESSSHWLSPSGNIAFGFYKLACTGSSPYCPDRYVVGIWFVKSPFKTLIWTAKRDDLRKPSSILFTNDGKLVLRTMPDNEEIPLIPDIQEPVSYAMMHDNSNFVLYGTKSQILFESFNYPTDTILGGQMLRPGVGLISGGIRLSVQETNGLVAMYNQSSESVSVISHALHGLVGKPVILSLDTTGSLYLVGSNGEVLKYLYQNKNQQEGSITVNEDVHMYRATLDSGGHFNLYKERIDGYVNDHEKSSVLLQSWPIHHMSAMEIALIVIGSIEGLCLLAWVCWCCWSSPE